MPKGGAFGLGVVMVGLVEAPGAESTLLWHRIVVGLQSRRRSWGRALGLLPHAADDGHALVVGHVGGCCLYALHSLFYEQLISLDLALLDAVGERAVPCFRCFFFETCQANGAILLDELIETGFDFGFLGFSGASNHAHLSDDIRGPAVALREHLEFRTKVRHDCMNVVCTKFAVSFFSTCNT